MNNEIISIVIPLYNTELEYFENCLNSIEEQTLKEQLEIVIIDDKSSIDYSEIINKYSKRLNIKYEKLNTNSGPGTCRRVGMLKSTGELIMFVDSDDLLHDKYCIEILYNVWKLNPKLNMVSGRAIEELSDGSYKIRKYNFIWVFAKLFNRQFLIDNKILFNDTRANEDNGFTTLFRMCTDDYQFVDSIVYIWKFNKNSITRKNNFEYYFTSIEGYINNMIWAYNECVKRNIDTTDKSLNHFTNVWIRLYLYSVEVLFDRNKDDFKKLIEWIKIYYNECYFIISKYISKERFENNYFQMMEDNFETFNKRVCLISYNQFYELVSNNEDYENKFNNLINYINKFY